MPSHELLQQPAPQRGPALTGGSPPFRRVLCALQGRGGLGVVERAALLPLAPEASLTALKLPLPRSRWGWPKKPALAADEVRQRLALARGAKAELLEVAAGKDGPQAIAEEALRRAAEVVVVAPESTDLGSRLFGATPEHLARMGRFPVLTVRRRPKGRYSKILVAVDFSEASRAAMDLALRMAQGQGELKVLHVYDTSYSLVLHQTTDDAEDIVRYVTAQRSEAKQRLRAFLKAYAGARPRPQPLLDAGDPTGEVARIASRCGADLVVVGQHGFRSTVHSLLGSVSEAAMHKAPCDVLIATLTSDEEQH